MIIAIGLACITLLIALFLIIKSKFRRKDPSADISKNVQFGGNSLKNINYSQNIHLLDLIKNSLEIDADPERIDTALFRFIGVTNILEVLVYLQIRNICPHSVTILKITWDFWLEGLHIKYGTASDKLYFDKQNAKQRITLREVLLDSQTSDVLWASQKSKGNGYLEGVIYCETAYGRFQKQFSLLKLNFSVSGEAKEKPKDMMDESYMDGLTGLLQRKFIEDNLQTIIDRNIHRGTITFCMIDIDNFKKINDECGHLMGDDVLKTVCAEIKNALQERGIAIRYGGDEIAVFMPSCSIEDAQALMETLRAKVEKLEFNIPDAVVHVTLSIGIASITEQTSYKVLVKVADNMLRFSKQNGKNRVSVNLRKKEAQE